MEDSNGPKLGKQFYGSSREEQEDALMDENYCDSDLLDRPTEIELLKDLLVSDISDYMRMELIEYAEINNFYEPQIQHSFLKFLDEDCDSLVKVAISDFVCYRAKNSVYPPLELLLLSSVPNSKNECEIGAFAICLAVLSLIDKPEDIDRMKSIIFENISDCESDTFCARFVSVLKDLGHLYFKYSKEEYNSILDVCETRFPGVTVGYE